MNVGIAGTGKMGAAIALRLMEVGHRVTVWNRSPEKIEPLRQAGAAAAATPAALAAPADAIVTILTDAAAIDAVYDGPAGLLSGDVAGKLFIEMSTVQPATEVALAGRVRAKGAVLVECPVGGTTGPARQGQLIGLLGAEPADAARARPLLQQLCRRIEHCGPVGAAAAVKLAINLPLMVSWQAFGEAFALCRETDMTPPQLLSLFTDISAATNALKARAPLIAAMLAGAPEAIGTTFTVDSGLKDLRTMAAEGRARGIDLPLVARTADCYEEVSRNGWGSRDGSAMAVYWSSRKR
ncbi:MAG: NAD(P)-dependent oxidoreductase [Hyphomicrobiales bacterium]|nr:NAD(P)-dependent oxidoreductase [Hyphomicrobiales bacterium]